MTDRPTPETDAVKFRIEDSNHFAVHVVHARRLERERDDLLDRLTALEHSTPIELAKLERERDEARDSAEKAKAYKRVLKEDNAKVRRELDELNKRLIEVCQYGVVCTIEREDLRKELADLKEARK